MFFRCSSLYALSAVLAATPAFTQQVSYSVGVVQSRPQGELANHVGIGYGINGAFILRSDSASALSLRADISGIQYGSTSRNLSLGDPTTNGLQLELNTSHYILPLTVGVQIEAPRGLIRPYIMGGAGFQAYFTETRLSDERQHSNVASTTNQSDLTFSTMLGAGAYVPFAIRSKSIQLDAGVQYLDGAKVKYLTADGIASGSTALSPLESDSHMLVIKVGASFQW